MRKCRETESVYLLTASCMRITRQSHKFASLSLRSMVQVHLTIQRRTRHLTANSTYSPTRLSTLTTTLSPSPFALVGTALSHHSRHSCYRAYCRLAPLPVHTTSLLRLLTVLPLTCTALHSAPTSACSSTHSRRLLWQWV